MKPSSGHSHSEATLLKYASHEINPGRPNTVQLRIQSSNLAFRFVLTCTNIHLLPPLRLQDCVQRRNLGPQGVAVLRHCGQFRLRPGDLGFEKLDPALFGAYPRLVMVYDLRCKFIS